MVEDPGWHDAFADLIFFFFGYVEMFVVVEFQFEHVGPSPELLLGRPPVRSDPNVRFDFCVTA